MSTRFAPIQTANLLWKNGLPYSTDYQDIYFSSQDGLQERLLVFIEGNRLIERWSAKENGGAYLFTIGEVGFGFGLNFLLTWSLWQKHAPSNARLHYFAAEKHPLTLDDLKKGTALWPSLAPYAAMLHEAYPVLTPGMHTLHFDNQRVNLHLMLGDAATAFQDLLICGDPEFEAQQRQRFVDAWFLDGFSPQQNPDSWSHALFITLSMLSKKETTLSTYSVAGVVKKGLTAAGFAIHKAPGFGSKKNSTIGYWKSRPKSTLKRTTPWHSAYQKKVTQKHALVLGAGFAGACVANALAVRGWRVTVMDSHVAPGQGASGNRHAILFPNLSAYTSPFTDFMLSAFLYAHRFYKACFKKWIFQGELHGILQLESQRKSSTQQEHLIEWLKSYPELGVYLTQEEASQKAGVLVRANGMYIPLAGWLDSPALCAHLIHQPGIEFVPNYTVQTLFYDAGEWNAEDYHADILIIANGYQANQFIATQHLALQAIRGQMTYIRANEKSRALRIPICGDGHVLPDYDNLHGIGATHGLMLRDTSCHAADDEINFYKLNQLPIDLALDMNIEGNWAGVRAGSLDHLPIVGPVAEAARFKQTMASISSDPNRWIPSSGSYLDGLYIMSGFGSRGLTTIPLCAEYLASLIHCEMSILPRSLMQCLSPARFLQRSLVRAPTGFV